MTERGRFHLVQLLPLALVVTGVLGWIATQMLPDRWIDTGMLAAAGFWVVFGNAAAWNGDKRAWRRAATAIGGIMFLAAASWALWPLNDPF